MKGKLYQKQGSALVDVTPNAVPMLKYELCEVYGFLNPALRPGFVEAAGGLIADAPTRYPLAWAYLQTAEGGALCVNEAQWQAMSTATYYTDYQGNTEGWNGVGGVPKFVIDTANGTIRVPDLRGMYMESSGLDSLAVGDVHGPGVPGITATTGTGGPNDFSGLYGISSPTGAFYIVNDNKTNVNVLINGDNKFRNLGFNASRSSGAYGAGGAQRVRPRAFGVLACVYLGA